jgi:hypothetical protein
MVILAVGAASVLLLAVVVWMGTRMVRNPDPSAGAVAGAFGSGLGVFDPGAARAAKDLEDDRNHAEIVPTPDEHDRPTWRVDLTRGTVKIPPPERPAE